MIASGTSPAAAIDIAATVGADQMRALRGKLVQQLDVDAAAADDHQHAIEA